MSKDQAYVGLDTHKKTIAAAIASGERNDAARYYGQLSNDPVAIERLVKRLEGRYAELCFCYEAGPCGFGLHRQLTTMGHRCLVVAPSNTPTRPGDRVKNDRRDATSLARLLRAGELTPIWVPDPAHEAMRDLVRARTAAMQIVKMCRQQMQGFLLRQGRIYPGKAAWTKTHLRWLRGLVFEHPAHYVFLHEQLSAIQDNEERMRRLEGQMVDLLPSWSLAPVVKNIQAMRGVSHLTAVILTAEVGDFARFDHPRRLMSYLGLAPSEHSSGSRVLRGAITKAGSSRARRVLIESAWAYRLPARVSKKIAPRLEGLPQEVGETAWRAQLRLCKRYRLMQARGKPKQVVVTAIAREMVGFIWAIARMSSSSPTAGCPS